MNTSKRIICTLGPSSLNPKVIKKLDKHDVSIFRINLSHTPLDKVRECVEIIQKSTDKPVCLDTEGAQVRTRYMASDNIYFSAGDVINIHRNIDRGDEQNVSFSPDNVYDELKTGDILSVDFDTVQLKILSDSTDNVRALVLCGGKVGHNKAVTINREIKLPPLSNKDVEAIKIGMEINVEYVALSFASAKEDVEYVRSLVKNETKIISKIESNSGLKNLDDILDATDSILIDRGDLSREQHLEKIPFLQQQIIGRAKSKNRDVYVATNLLESMVTNKKPTRAEVNDVVSTLLAGADGLVLAAETAIGDYPAECAFMIKKLIKSYEACKGIDNLDELRTQTPVSFYLPSPCGGKLVNRVNLNCDQEELQSLPTLKINKEILIDLEQLAVGTYSPQEGFCTREEIRSVLEDYKLPDGTIWTLPIMLQTSKEKISSFKIGDRIALTSEATGEIYGTLELSDIYEFDFEYIASNLFGTTSMKHPGVARLKENGEMFLGGKIELVKFIPTEFRSSVFTPHETRMIFEHNGWSQVVGFHTRNVAHRAHEYLQKKCLEHSNIDGLLIHPVIGQKKKGDFHTKVIIETYRRHIHENLNPKEVLFGAFNTYSRYAGPREAVFTALCRKNFGCSHFVVGRDHTGVGRFYGENASKEIFNKLGDIGITPIFFDKISYCPKRDDYIEGEDDNKNLQSISGSRIRNCLVDGELPPEFLMRESTAKMIIDLIQAGEEVFI